MELRDNAYAAIGAMIVSALLGIFTGGYIFFAVPVALLLLFAADYYRIRLMARQITRELIIIKSLSEPRISPGDTVLLTIKLMFSRGLALKLLVSQPLDDTIDVEPSQETVPLSRRMIKETYFTLTPKKYGDFSIGPLKLTAESLLFRDTLFSGTEETLAVRPDVGQDTGELDAILNEDVHQRDMPTYFLMDTDPSMADGDGRSSLDCAIDLITRLYVYHQPSGLLCFSRPGIVKSIEPGEAFPDALANIRTDRDHPASERPVSRSLHDLYEQGAAFDDVAGHAALRPIFEKTLAEYAANIDADGFSRAVRQVIETAATPSHMIVITNLSMGMAGLLNGIQLANFHGCTISVILTPRTWPGENDLMDIEKRYREYEEMREAIAKLRADSIKVHEYCPDIMV